jgi:hypothetical protein
MTDIRVLEKARRALQEFLASDSYLLGVQASERSITHKLAESLQRQFPHLDVDCEYNRYLGYEKMMAQLRVFPDIVVHKRGTMQNVLVTEVKKSNNYTSHNSDVNRLCKFTTQPMSYQVGLFVEFGVGRKQHPVVEAAIFCRGGPAYQEWRSRLLSTRARHSFQGAG